jgi:hypothetical protein
VATVFSPSRRERRVLTRRTGSTPNRFDPAHSQVPPRRRRTRPAYAPTPTLSTGGRCRQLGAGILYALPVGVVTILAFDWFSCRPCARSTRPPAFVLGLSLVMSVSVGAVATEAGRRAVAFWWEVVGQCGDAAELMEILGQQRPDVVVVDIPVLAFLDAC